MAYIGNSPANTGNYQLVDDIASSFNGTLVSFALASGGIAITPAKSGQILANINGVMQEPDDGGTNGFKVVSSNIVFSSAPASGDTFWAVYQGQNVDIGTPSDDVVDTAHIKDDAVTADKLANAINTEIAANTAKTGITSGQASAITANTAKTGITSGQASAITANTAKVTNSTSASDLASGTLPTARLPAGSVLQVVYATITSGAVSTTSASYVDTGVTASITPTSSSSKILIQANAHTYINNHAANDWSAANFDIVRGSTQVYQTSPSPTAGYTMGSFVTDTTSRHMDYVPITYLDSPSTTSAVTYKVRAASRNGYSMNFQAGYGHSNITLTEIAG